MSKKRLKKSLWVPLALLVYSIAVIAYFLPKNTNIGETEKWLIVIADMILIAFIWWIYRKRDKMAERRNNDSTNSKKKNCEETNI